MNAPDKIYVNIPGDYWHPGTDEKVNTDTEYIRKDALLRWAKSQKARLKQGHKHEWKNDDILHGGTLILDSLINEIESL